MQGTHVLAGSPCQENVDTHVLFIDLVNTIAPVAMPTPFGECDDIPKHVINFMSIQNVLTLLRVNLC